MNFASEKENVLARSKAKNTKDFWEEVLKFKRKLNYSYYNDIQEVHQSLKCFSLQVTIRCDCSLASVMLSLNDLATANRKT